MKRLLPWIVFASLALAGAWWWTSAKRTSVRTELPERAVRKSDDGATALLVPARKGSSLRDAPTPDLRPVVLRIRSATGPYSGAPRVPDIAFEVCRTTGWDRSAIASSRTDARGDALLELPLGDLASTAFGGPPLRVRVIEPGFQQRWERGRAVPGEPRAFEFFLMAKRGATLRGTVVDARGARVRAAVSLRRWNVDQGGRLEVVSEAGSGSGEDGRFELHVAQAIEGAVLVADAEELGTGALADVDVALDSAPQDLRVVVHGAGVLRGQVRDGSGAPAAGASLLVLHASLDDGRGCPPPYEGAVAVRLRGAGRGAVETHADEGGRFEVRGLLPDTYVVRARAGPDYPRRYDQLLTPRPVAADGAELALRMARPTLLVRLLDAEGQPWRKGDARTKATPEGTAEWPARPEVLAYPVEEVGGRACPAERELDSRSVSDGETAFDVLEGARYLVGAIGAAFDGRLEEVVLEPGSAQVVVELRARDVDELGSIEVHVVHEGRELSWTSDEGPFELALLRADQTVELLRIVYPKDPPYFFRVPAGAYRVCVDGAANRDFYHGTVRSPRELGRGEAEVTVRAGATHELAVEIDQGGKLEVTLEGEPSEADRHAVLEHEPRLETLAMTGEERGRRIEEQAARAVLHLVDARGRRTPLVRLGRADIAGGGENELDVWELGATILSERMPTGAHTLIGRLPSGRTARAEVVLRAGETTRVKLVF